jgi:hypothetical protein
VVREFNSFVENCFGAKNRNKLPIISNSAYLRLVPDVKRFLANVTLSLQCNKKLSQHKIGTNGRLVRVNASGAIFITNTNVTENVCYTLKTSVIQRLRFAGHQAWRFGVRECPATDGSREAAPGTTIGL